MSRTKAKRPRIPQKTSNRQLLSMVMTIALPVALQNVLTTTGSMVDTMMLGTIGQNTVGAVGLCAQFSSLLFSGFWGFVGGGMLFFAQYWGAGNDEGILRSYGIMLAFMAIPATVFSSLALGAPYFVMRIYTSSVPIQEIGVRYLRVVGFSYPLMVLATAMSALLRSTERVKIPLAGGIAAVITNFVCNYILIFGKLGFPALGVEAGRKARRLAFERLGSACRLGLLAAGPAHLVTGRSELLGSLICGSAGGSSRLPGLRHQLRELLEPVLAGEHALRAAHRRPGRDLAVGPEDHPVAGHEAGASGQRLHGRHPRGNGIDQVDIAEKGLCRLSVRLCDRHLVKQPAAVRGRLAMVILAHARARARHRHQRHLPGLIGRLPVKEPGHGVGGLAGVSGEEAEDVGAEQVLDQRLVRPVGREGLGDAAHYARKVFPVAEHP